MLKLDQRRSCLCLFNKTTTPQFFNIEVALTSKPKTTNYKPLVVGVSMGGGVVAAVLALVIIMARRKRKPKQTEKRSQPFG